LFFFRLFDLNLNLNLKVHSETVQRKNRKFIGKSRILRNFDNMEKILKFQQQNFFLFYLKNIPVDRQRLIFQGRELKDNSSLSEFGNSLYFE
jgi:hypothetical protein